MDYLLAGEALPTYVREQRRRHRRIVLTNGCFDVLHAGHVAYLKEARQLGDVLIVGVNTDGSVRRLKGAGRPLNPVGDRVEVLAALACVDHVVVFEETHPRRLIEAVRPDVYVKGGDYGPELPERELVESLGGRIAIMAHRPGRSTTALVERIRAVLEPGR